MTVNQHPDRLSLHNEVHARPYEAIAAPSTLYHWVFETNGVDAAQIVAHLTDLLMAHHLPVPSAHSNHMTIEFPHFKLRWEKHAEFVTYTAWQARPSSLTLIDALPQSWLDSAQGRLLSAIELRVQTQQSHKPHTSSAAMVRSHLADGSLSVSTDFAVQGNGFSVWDLTVHNVTQVSEQRLGTISQRLLEIETYRMMALLGLPAARVVGVQLTKLEQDLAGISMEINSASKSQEPVLLEKLTRLASQVESLLAANHARFSATSAYMSLIEQRLLDLNEQAVGDYSTIASFFSRRLTPAAQTCAWASKRLQALSERVSRNSNLLRTRVEIEQQEHHKSLLSTMTERQLSQLRLQTTVEGLSAIAICYYAAGIVGYIAKAMMPFGWPLSTEMTTALSIPLAFIAVTFGFRKIKHAVLQER